MKKAQRVTPQQPEISLWFGAAWLLGTPTAIIGLWFVANQIGC